jgi:hypothetical protein
MRFLLFIAVLDKYSKFFFLYFFMLKILLRLNGVIDWLRNYMTAEDI